MLLLCREENLPNTMLEAMACGTPVISLPSGGQEQVIKDGVNGILGKEISVNALKKAIIRFMMLKDQFKSGEIRRFAEQNFAPKIIANKYTELYKSVL